MKWVSTMLLFTIAVTVLAPFSCFSIASAGSDEPALGTLDVCNGSTPALSAHGEMPCVAASICIAAPLITASTTASPRNIYIELILSSRNEQPPQS